jgi:hypothetical protein
MAATRGVGACVGSREGLCVGATEGRRDGACHPPGLSQVVTDMIPREVVSVCLSGQGRGKGSLVGGCVALGGGPGRGLLHRWR